MNCTENKKIRIHVKKLTIDELEEIQRLANSLYCDAIEYKMSLRGNSPIYDEENKSIRNRSIQLIISSIYDIVAV